MAGLVPAIHVFDVTRDLGVDARHRAGHDGSAFHHRNHLRSVRRLRLIEQRLHGRREGGVLGGRQFHDLAALDLDRAPRIAVLLERETALEGDGVRHGLAHGSLHVLRPGVERPAVQEDRPRDIEMIGDGVEAVELVHPVGHRVGEVLALLRKGGIDRHLAYDVLTNSLFDSKVHKTYGGKIVDERYTPPGFAVPLATKDLRLALAAAEKSQVPMPAASLVHDHLVELAARGWAELDWSALGLLAAVDAGLSEA